MQGFHTITVVIELKNYPDLTQYIKKTKTFRVEVEAICDKTVFVNPGIPHVLYQLLESTTIIKFEGFKDMESIKNKPFDGSTYCGKRNFTMKTLSPAIKFDPVANNFKIASKNVSDVGTHEVLVKGVLANYPSAKPASFGFKAYIVNSCSAYKLVPFEKDMPLMPINYQVGGRQKT